MPLTVALFFAVLTLNAIFLPVIYRLGVEQSRTILGSVCIGGAVLLIGGLLLKNSAVIGLVEALVRLAGQSALKLISGSAALAAVSNVISFCLSVPFYTNRRYGVYD